MNSCSRAHVDKVRNNPSKKFHIANLKIYEIFQEIISDGVLFWQIYWQSNYNFHSTADVPLDFFENFQISFY